MALLFQWIDLNDSNMDDGMNEVTIPSYRTSTIMWMRILRAVEQYNESHGSQVLQLPSLGPTPVHD